MAKFLRRRERKEAVTYGLVFNYPGTQSGFSFDCDLEGNVPQEEMTEAALRNLWESVLGLNGTEFDGIATYRSSWVEPAIIECNSCGSEVTLHSSWASACGKCGTEYNGSGQQLRARHHWGEDTGESFYCGCGSCPDDY